MESQSAKQILATWVTKVKGYSTPVVSYDDAVHSVELAEEEMKEKAIESYIENCEYKSDWCCGCAEAHGAILSEPDVCMGRDCPYVKGFIDKLNS